MIPFMASKSILRQRKCSFPMLTRSKSRDIRHICATPTRQIAFKTATCKQSLLTLRRKTYNYNHGIHTAAYLAQKNTEGDSPYWFENEPQEIPKKKYFNFRLPKLKGRSVGLKTPSWTWKSSKQPQASIAKDSSSSDSVICDDSMATMHVYQSMDLIHELERTKQKQSLQNEISKITPSQEEALITEYLKYQKDLASRLGEFWGDTPSQESAGKLSNQATDVKLTAPYNALNRVLDSYSATINSLSNVHKHLSKYEKFLPQKLMDKIPGFSPQAANASILEGNSENPDIVKVKNVQGLRTLLKDLEEEESRINKEQIKARQEEFRDDTFRKLFACQYSPYQPKADRKDAALQTPETTTATTTTTTRKRWHIPGWDPAHSLANESLFPSFEAIIPGRNVCATVEEEEEKRKMSKPELEESFMKLMEDVKRNHPKASDYNKSLHDLNEFLKQNSKLRSLLYEQNLVYLIAKEMKKPDLDDLTMSLSRETLTLAGHLSPINKRGVRILAIDGGGVRAVMTALILKRLQEECGVPLHEMFDYVIGVSTGSILTVMSIVYRVPLDDCLQMYKLFSLEVFKRNIILGATRLVWSQSFYDSDYWSALLREDFGDLKLSETARSPDIPKMAIVSTATNLPTLTPFVFRNYNLPPNTPSQYPGSCNARVWEAVRASSAAPGYFEEYKLRDIVHQDGGLIVNNPAALAIHEVRLLWPKEEIQCLVSLGTGRYYPHTREKYAESGLKSKINKLIASATDVEAVHIVLQVIRAVAGWQLSLSSLCKSDYEQYSIRG